MAEQCSSLTIGQLICTLLLCRHRAGVDMRVLCDDVTWLQHQCTNAHRQRAIVLCETDTVRDAVKRSLDLIGMYAQCNNINIMLFLLLYCFVGPTLILRTHVPQSDEPRVLARLSWPNSLHLAYYKNALVTTMIVDSIVG